MPVTCKGCAASSVELIAFFRRGLFASEGENFAANQKVQSLIWSRSADHPHVTVKARLATHLPSFDQDLVIRMSVAKTLQRIKQFIPPLSGEMHKGQAGRVGVIGGSEE